MSSERRWGHSVWVWRALLVWAVLAICLLLFSLTESGRIFSVMLLIADAFIAVTLFVGWARTERFRLELDLGDDDDSRSY